jgi:hypothetical protein
MFLPTLALVHFIQQAREIKTRPQNDKITLILELLNVSIELIETFSNP